MNPSSSQESATRASSTTAAAKPAQEKGPTADAVRVESLVRKDAKGNPVRKVVGRKLAEALVRGKKWKLVDDKKSA